MIKHWTRFEGSPYGANRDRARVTLSPKKLILLNRIAYEAIGSPTAVELMFDEIRNMIGMKPIDPRRPNAFPLKPKKNCHHRVICAGSFCSHFRIAVDRTVLFNNIDIDNEGVMTLEMAGTTGVGRGSR